jgi:alpha-glucosidase
MLNLYRDLLRLRRAEKALGAGDLEWTEVPAGALGFRRGDITCIVNVAAVPIELPMGAELVLASGPLDAGRLPADTAALLRDSATTASPH